MSQLLNFCLILFLSFVLSSCQSKLKLDSCDNIESYLLEQPDFKKINKSLDKVKEQCPEAYAALVVKNNEDVSSSEVDPIKSVKEDWLNKNCSESLLLSLGSSGKPFLKECLLGEGPLISKGTQNKESAKLYTAYLKGRIQYLDRNITREERTIRQLDERIWEREREYVLHKNDGPSVVRHIIEDMGRLKAEKTRLNMTRHQYFREKRQLKMRLGSLLK